MKARPDTVLDRIRRSRWRLQTESERTLKFLGRLRNARQIGAVAPSGAALAARMVSEIDPGRGDVLEVGAGTGVFTAALLARGVLPSQLTVIEADPVFAQMLRARFPTIAIVQARAEDALSPDGCLGTRRFADVISGLPLLNFPISVRQRILALIFERLVDDGALYQFTYGPTSPVGPASLSALGLVAVPIGRVWRNLPPAAVYRIRRTVLHK